MLPGIYSDLSNAAYHGGEGVSKSMLDVLAQRSPLHLHHIRSAANDNVRAPTPAQAFGTAFHALLLEPGEFVKDYTLGLRRSDVPEAIEDRDQLVAMVEKLNETRLAKLPTSGSKDDLVARIRAAYVEMDIPVADRPLDLVGMKATDLSAALKTLNAMRQGKLATSGSRHELADLLRANGVPVTLWTDVEAQWLANNGHRNVLSPEHWDQLHKMRDAVMAHPSAYALLTAKPGKAEQSVYWRDEITGELCRCRPDFWREDGILVDLKTTEDASQEAFAASIANWRYHVQHPFYVDGVSQAIDQMAAANKGEAFPQALPAKPRAFVFLAVEKSACVVDGQSKGVAVYVLDDESIRLGRAEYRRDLATYAICRDAKSWPGYGDKIQSISLPKWKLLRGADLLDAA